MRNVVLLLLFLWITCPVPDAARAQQSQLPDAGEWIKKTEPGVSYDCPMMLNPSKNVVCYDGLISVSRSAGEFSLASTATLSCATAQCYLTFPVGSSATAYADWIMPSRAVTVLGLVLSWHSAATAGTVQWYIDWCQYYAGEAPCTPSGANRKPLPSSLTASGVRVDLKPSAWPWTNSWGSGAHVVWEIQREGYAPSSGDTVNGDVLLEGMRIEMTRTP